MEVEWDEGSSTGQVRKVLHCPGSCTPQAWHPPEAASAAAEASQQPNKADWSRVFISSPLERPAKCQELCSILGRSGGP